MSRHGLNQPRRGIVAGQQFRAEELTGLRACQLESLGDAFGLFAIDDPHLMPLQTDGQRVGLNGQQVVQASAGLGHERDAQVQRKPTQLAVEGFFADGQRVFLGGFDERLASAAVMHQQSIGQDLDEFGKRQKIFVAKPAMFLEARRQKGLVEGIAQEMQDRIGQRQPPKRLAKELRIAD